LGGGYSTHREQEEGPRADRAGHQLYTAGQLHWPKYTSYLEQLLISQARGPQPALARARARARSTKQLTHEEGCTATK